jgi:hypothetical protein
VPPLLLKEKGRGECFSDRFYRIVFWKRTIIAQTNADCLATNPETMDFVTFFDDIDSSGRLAGRFTLIRIEPTGTALQANQAEETLWRRSSVG